MVPLRNRCQYGPRCARDLLGKKAVKENEQKAEGCWKSHQIVVQVWLLQRTEGEKEGRIGRILDCRAVLWKFCQHQWGVSPQTRIFVSKVLCLTGLNIFVTLSHWLGAAARDCGLGEHVNYTPTAGGLKCIFPWPPQKELNKCLPKGEFE